MDFEGLVPLVIIVIGVVYQLIRKAMGGDEADQERARQQQEQEQSRKEAEAQPESKGPMLPYEDLVEQMFAPYIEERKRKHGARYEEEGDGPAIRVVEEVPVPAPAPEPEPASRILKESHPPLPVVEGEIGSTEVVVRRRRSLDEIVFRNPRLTAGARLVLASEILNRPRALRSPRAL